LKCQTGDYLLVNTEIPSEASILDQERGSQASITNHPNRRDDSPSVGILIASAIAKRLASVRFESLGIEQGLFNLYGGVPGVALFLSTWGATWDLAYYRSAAYRLLKQGDFLSQSSKELQFDSLGICRGAGAAIYTLCALGAVLKDEQLFDIAENVVKYAAGLTIDPTIEDLDLFKGLAGLVLAVSRMALVRPVSAVRNCVEVLSDRLRNSVIMFAAPPKYGGPLAGFAHGLSGASFALVAAFGASGNPDLLAAAARCIELESAVFDSDLHDWPDYRFNVLRSSGAWCHGWIGIGMARCAAVRLPGLRQLAQHDLSLAVDRALKAPLRSNDSLCCGNFGRVDFLLEAAEALCTPTLRTLALQIAERLSREAVLHKAFRDVSNDSSPGLFQGAAGYGYELLRVSSRERLPSVLAFEVRP
jgi:lantibiotic modifying enzyme